MLGLWNITGRIGRSGDLDLKTQSKHGRCHFSLWSPENGNKVDAPTFPGLVLSKEEIKMITDPANLYSYAPRKLVGQGEVLSLRGSLVILVSSLLSTGQGKVRASTSFGLLVARGKDDNFHVYLLRWQF